MMNMIPQNDNMIAYDGGDTQNPPLEVPDQHQTPENIPAKSIN